MALIKCKECGVEVSDKAKTCVKCGAPIEKSSFGSIVFGLLCIAFLVWGYKTITAEPATAAAANNSSSKVQVEQVYTSQPNNMVCAQESELIKAIQHAEAGEATLFKRMLIGHGGSQCIAFPSGVEVKILQIDTTKYPNHALIEFALADTPGGGGMWGADSLVLPK